MTVAEAFKLYPNIETEILGLYLRGLEIVRSDFQCNKEIF